MGVKESTEIIFRVKKVAGKGEFQDGRQNDEKKKLTNVSKLFITNEYPKLTIITSLQENKLGVFCWGLPSSIIESHQNKNGCGPGLEEELPKIFGSPFNIYATAEASDFKFSTQLRFAKAHHQINPEEKVVAGLG